MHNLDTATESLGALPNFPLLTGLSFAAIAITVAAGLIGLNGGRGVGDLWPFLQWTTLMSVAYSALSVTLLRWLPPLGPGLRIVVSLGLGIATASAFTLMVSFVLGGWFHAFSFPVTSCWMSGGVGAVNLSTRRRKIASTPSLIAEVLLASIVGFGIGLFAQAAVVREERDQELRLVFLKMGSLDSTASAGSVRPGVAGDYLSGEEESLIQLSGISGDLEFRGTSRHGTGAHAGAVIIMRQRLTESVDLPQPDGVTVLYVQERDGWRLFPADAPMLTRSIRLEPSATVHSHTMYYVELIGGRRQGGLAAQW